MARPGVTAYEISQAAASLVEEGINPTVERVRQRLGGGSNGTIAPLLKQWKQQNTLLDNAPSLPRRLTDAVTILYDEIQQGATETIKKAKEAAQSQVDIASIV